MGKRYVLVNVLSDAPLAKETFQIALANSVRRLFGDFGLARIDAKVVSFDATSSKAIVACTKEGIEELQAAIGLISDAGITALTVKVSGTIKGLRRR